jgi:galactose mutarotase-like enzyme
MSVFTSCSSEQPAPPFQARQLTTNVGGQAGVTLERTTDEESGQAHIVRVDILPGRGFNIYQIKAWLPDKGIINVMEAPPVEEAATIMNGGADDQYGNKSFAVGGAILVPFANRIRGRLLPDGKTIETTVHGKRVVLPANWKGRNPGAEPHAMHGLILASRMDQVTTGADRDHAAATGTLNAGDFGGHWPSKTHLTFSANLKRNGFEFGLTAKNVGAETLPMGIGWHPYFVFPSGQREQVRLVLPARQRALVNNYDDVFPTGRVEVVKGTPYDFTILGGRPLGKLFLDDTFVDIERGQGGGAAAEVIDSAAKYGLRVTGLSGEIQAFQVYAPPDKNYVALEPQFNLGDPYGKIWDGKVNTGMVIIRPGDSVTYSVRVEVFQP